MISKSLILLTVVCCLAVAGPSTAGSEPGAVAIKTHLMWHLSPAEGATPELATRVEKAVRAHFQATHGKALMDGLTMDSILLVEGNEKFLRCGTGAGCLSGLGELAGMRYVIAGEVALRNGRTFTRLVLVDTSSKQITSRAVVESAGVPTASALGELAVAMFTPDRYVGSIELSAPVKGAQVLLDGQPAGVTPLVGPLSDVVAGEHLVEVKKPGHQPYSRTIRVPLGKSVRVVALLPKIAYLEPKARPFYVDWPFWTALGVGAAALGVAGGLHYDAGILQDNADEYKRANLDGAAEKQDRADARFLQAYVMYGIGGAGLLAAGLIAIIDAATGDPGEPADAQPEPAAIRFEVGPSAGGLGLGARIRF